MAMQSIAQIFDLRGKVAIVTGGGAGIGQGIALRLAEAGASVMIADMDLAGARKTAEQVGAKGGKAKAVRANTTVAADVDQAVQATVEEFGSLDILVNNAGIYPASATLDISEESWDKVFKVNVTGVFLFSQSAIRQMIKQGHGGKIINMASEAGLHPSGMMAHYEASKAAVLMLTKSLALEFGPRGILVNAVVPGNISTHTQEAAVNRIAKLVGADEKALTEVRKSKIPLRRFGEPDDVAKVVLFLASSASDYMTGSMLLADGGHLLS